LKVTLKLDEKLHSLQAHNNNNNEELVQNSESVLEPAYGFKANKFEVGSLSHLPIFIVT
jgi:hypothetical protein